MRATEPTSCGYTLAKYTFALYRAIGTIEWWKRPRFSPRTYLSSLGRVTVKPPVDSTRQRYWGSSSSVARAILRSEMSEHASCRLSHSYISRRATFILPFRFIHLRAIWSLVHSFIHSFTRSSIRSSVCRTTNSLVHSFVTICIVLLFHSIFFLALFQQTFLPSLFADICSDANPNSWLLRERAITILHF